MRHMTLALLFLLLAGFAGCRTSDVKDDRPIAEDLVCLFNGDLGCVSVRVDASTPRAAYEGKVYYFCSDECRLVFEKNQAKYLPK